VEHGFHNIGLCSYTIKFNINFGRIIIHFIPLN
jgi:hypothetical protein